MASAKKSGESARDTAPVDQDAPARPQPQLADGAASARPSPALGLQRRLDAAYGEETGKWSARRTLLFILATCGGFWGLVLALLLRR
jgi:hypothetical protein